MGTAMVLSCIAFGILFMGGVPLGPLIKVLVCLRRGRRGLRPGRPLPAGPDPVLPQPRRPPVGLRLPGLAVADRAGLRAPLRPGPRRRPREVGDPPERPHRLHLLGGGRGARLVGAVVLLLLFFALAWYGLRAAARAPDRFGCLLAVGITTWITSQAVINIGAVIGVLPVTGIPLPVHLLRRLVPGHHHGGRGHPHEHRRAGTLRRPGPPAAPTPRPGVTDPHSVTDRSGLGRPSLRAGGRRGHRRPPPAGPGHRRGPGRPGPRPAEHRVRRVRAGPGRGHARPARVPGHPAARPGHRAQPRPRGPGPQPPVRAGLAVAAVPGRPGGRPGPAPGGGVGRRLRQPGRLAGGPGAPGAAGAGQRRCRAGGGQPAVRPVRPGQRGRLGGHSAAPGGGDRHPGATRDRRRRPGAGRPARPPGPELGLPGRPAGRGRVRRLARGPADQPGASTGLAARWADRATWPIYHIVGRRDWADYSADRPWSGSRHRRPHGPPAPTGLVARCGCPTRSGWTWCTPPPTWWCAGPGR